MKQTVLIVGSLNMDSFRYVDELPKPGETVSAANFEEGVGGKGCNQAAMAGLWAQKLKGELGVAMLGCVGGDSQGQVLVQTLANHGVHTDTVRKLGSEIRSGSAAITVDKHGENTIVVHPGANFELSTQHLQELIETNNMWQQTSLVLCQNEIPLEVTGKALLEAKKEGKLALWNFAPAARTHVPREIFESCSVLLVNETEAMTTLQAHLKVESMDQDMLENSGDPKASLERIAGRLAAALDHRVAIVLTAGALGAIVASHEKLTWASTRIKVSKDKVIDTTGAGDCFAGVFALELARLHGKQGDSDLAHDALCSAASLACDAGALSIQHRGCVASYTYVRDNLELV
mmetsp:Transcript_412/g.967  ORF Transcript_412/g.967 Transcript_412/m.967 type:complete len:347 (-) Transcript_412:85-1125(-)